MEVVEFGGWRRCARLNAGGLEAIVTLEVGPRVLRFGRVGGPNELNAYERHAGMTGGSDYRSYGGHRLWTAPEVPERTYEADNSPVDVEEADGWLRLTTPLGPTRLQKSMRLKMDPIGPRLVLEHTIRNLGDAPVRIAPWCVTVMAPGGTCLVPLPAHRPHPEALLPGGPIVLWRYTRMRDPRWTWGDRLVRLRQTAGMGPQKFGALVEQGLAAYANHGNLFLKRFPHAVGADYPDFGVNFEAFTREDMLEIESLGPIANLVPGESVQHREVWHLLPDVVPPEDEAACADLLDRLAASRPLD